MPRIRKKTSKRVSIHEREKMKKKVRDSRKKKGKEARKSVQWKSKHPKDPGIPNNFPYKDQILAEVAEQRRIAAEEKQRRKDEKKAAKVHDPNDSNEDEEAFDGVKSLSLSARADIVSADGEDEQRAEDEDKDEVPVLIDPGLPHLKAVLDAADAVVEVLDARDPLGARSAHLEGLVCAAGKKVLLVLGKVDTCPREAVEAWAGTLRTEHPTVLFRSASACLPASAADTASAKGKGKARESAHDAWGLDAATTILRQWAEEHKGDAPFTVAVIGLTNVGKTSFVNSLLRKPALQTYRLTSAAPESFTTTVRPQEVAVELEGGRQLRVIDTPGLAWHPVEDEDEGASPEESARTRARDILLRTRGRIERLKDPSPVLAEIVSRATREDLMLLYNLPIFTDGDAGAFLAGVARANGFIKKKGDPDLAGAARMVLRDWSSGKLARYTQPAASPSPSPPSAEASSSLAEIYATDNTVLSRLSTRKELRKAGGLVKLRPAGIDARKAVLDASYLLASDDEGMEADEEDAGTVDDMDEVGLSDEESEGDYVSDEEEGSDGEDGDEEDEDEDEPASPPRGKRKRALAKAPARPAKRVAFAPEPKGTKQARSAAGARTRKAKGDSTKPEPKPAKKPVKAPLAAKTTKKVANGASSKSKKAAAAPAKEGEDAYDFGQFF